MKPRSTVLLCLALIAALVSATRVAAHPVGETAPFLLAEYGKIHDALASDRVEGVVEAAARIASTASEMIGHAGASEKGLYEELAAAAGKMQGDDLTTLRTHLGALTVALDALLRAAGATGWRLFHCSMAGGYWIQTDEKIRNPYYGPAMLGCGDAVESVAKR